MNWDKGKLTDFCNRFAVPLQFLGSCALYYLIEVLSRHSFVSAWKYMTGSPVIFLYNALLIFMTSTIAFLFRRRIFWRLFVLFFWLVLGVINGVILLNRVTPFTGPDLALLSDAKKVASKYLTPVTVVLAVIGIAAMIFALVMAFLRSPKYKGKRNWIVDLVIVVGSVGLFFGSTKVLLDKRIISSYFGNIAFAYQDYGYPYCLGVTIFDTGISQPNGYSEKLIDEIEDSEGKQEENTNSVDGKQVNVIFLQLESFFDPETVNFLNISEDPIPNFRRLSREYTSGYLHVPVVGAGTANTEFEAISGMSLRYFGAGEYPYKSILKEQTAESIPYDLRQDGYETHAIHNNEANFYARRSVYKRLGFDSFTSEEYMPDISDVTETGWVKDHILTDEIMKCLTSSTNPDYIYTVSVQGHGDYPSEPVIEDPEITVTGAEDRDQNNNSWEYYCKQIHEMDQFVKDLTDTLSKFDEPVILAMYGDHLPTMGLETEDLTNKYLFQTPYIIWNNFGLKKSDKNLTSYQIGSEVLDEIGIHNGTMVRFHQTRKNTKNYQVDMEALQYDILYGQMYAYGGTDEKKGVSPFKELDMRMGVEPISLDGIELLADGSYKITGKHFTASSKLEVNGKLAKNTVFVSPTVLLVSDIELNVTDTVDIAQQSNSSTAKVLTRTERRLYSDYLPEAPAVTPTPEAAGS